MSFASEPVFFDEQDANLFLVDDARLRADALQHSLLPRLRNLMHVAIAEIRDIYGIEALDDSIVSVYPNFRQKRKRVDKANRHSLWDPGGAFASSSARRASENRQRSGRSAP